MIYKAVLALLQRFDILLKANVVRIPFGLVNRVYQNELTIEVAPESIISHADHAFIKKNPSFLCNSNWDEKVFDIMSIERCKRVVDVINSIDNLTNCHSYNQYIQALNEGKPILRHGKPLDSMEKIDDYFKGLIHIYRDMRENGYKSSSELGAEESDICVGISRSGNIIQLQSGHHRIALAKMAKVPTVKVKVILIHYLFWKKNKSISQSLKQAVNKNIGL